MTKVRVYELAKETGLPNKEVIRRLGELGVAAKSHSSTVAGRDADTFRESLGKAKAERQRQAEERARAEAEEYDLAAVASPAPEAKARRILPPHLRKQQEDAEQAKSQGATQPGEGAEPTAKQPAEPSAAPGGSPSAPAAFRPPPTKPAFKPGETGGVSVGGDEEPTPGEEVVAEQTAEPTAQPKTRTDVSDGEPEPEVKPTPTASEAAKAGVVRPAGEKPAEPPPVERSEPPTPKPQPEEPRGVPGVPRPGTPPRPGQPTRSSSPTTTGAPVERRRRLDHDLPKEGSGKRAIPPPLRPAPKDQPAAGDGRSAAPPRKRSSEGRRPADGQRPGGQRPAAGPRPGGGQRPGGPPPSAPAGPGGPPKGAPGRPGKGKKKKGKRREPTLADQFEEQQAGKRRQSGPVKATVSGPVEVVSGITVGELAKAIGVNPTDIVRVLFGMGEMITVTQSMSDDLVELVAAELEADLRFVSEEELDFGAEEDEEDTHQEPRGPVVTVMGHVDHGKTKLLDAFRTTDVVSREAGGITQHIGAYQVTKDGRKITFIDTPGHEAFTQMRARGASVTDVAILVVAADDGVMPQTVEAINHIRAAEIPIIVAVNKIDKETADPVRVRTQLTEHDLVAEEFGGQTTMVDVSALSGLGLDDLLEMVLLQADVAELKANPDRDARGSVVEANLDRGRGAVATVLVQAGTLRIGDVLVAGISDCKVRAMFTHDGRQVTEAGPSMPVQVLGWSEVPDAGDEFRVVSDERTAREIAANRQARERRQELANRRALSLDELSGAIEQGKLQTLNLIIKGDVAGSVEALADAMLKLELPGEVRIQIIHKGVGGVTESDVDFAATSQAIIIAFNVRPGSTARTAIEESGVDVRQYSIIYQATEDIERAVKGLLAPEYQEVVVGRAEVREIFSVPRAGKVFGSYVTEGEIKRHAKVRVIRDSVVTADDTITSLRRFKEDVTTVATNYECGIGLDKFQDVKVGDEFEAYEDQEVARS